MLAGQPIFKRLCAFSLLIEIIHTAGGLLLHALLTDAISDFYKIIHKIYMITKFWQNSIFVSQNTQVTNWNNDWWWKILFSEKKNPVKMNTKWKKNIYLENLNSNYIKSLFAIKQLVNTVGKLFELHVVDDIQAFINYNFSCKRFRAHKTVLRARPCTWEIVHVINNTWYGDRNCTKLVLKPLAAKNGLSVSVLCIAPFLKIILFQYILWPPSIFAACTLHDLFT